MSMRLFLLVAAALCAIAVQGGKVKRAVGGRQFEYGEYPALVSLWYLGDTSLTKNAHGHACGAALVDPSWVVTAATCFEEIIVGSINTSLYQVWLGMYGQKDAQDQGQLRLIDSVFILDTYELVPLLYDNVALIKLDEPANLSSPYVDTIAIDEDPNCPATGDTCTMTGWGKQDDKSYGVSSEFPNAVDVDIQDQDGCARNYAFPEGTNLRFQISEKTLCAGKPEGGKDSCIYDSGSPLFCTCTKTDEAGNSATHRVLAGIVSIHHGCGIPRYPGIYSKVSYFSPWIKHIISHN